MEALCVATEAAGVHTACKKSEGQPMTSELHTCFISEVAAQQHALAAAAATVRKDLQWRNVVAASVEGKSRARLGKVANLELSKREPTWRRARRSH